MELDPASAFQFQLMRSNILSLCVSEKLARQRDSVILLKEPQPCSIEQLNTLDARFSQMISALNEEQQYAVLKCVLADNYHMVLGTPGSGKTEAIVVLIKILAQMRKKVLVVSYTN